VKILFLVLKLVALAGVAFTAGAHNTMFSSAPARTRPTDVWIAVVLVLGLFVVSHLFFPTRLDRILTVLVLVLGLILPAVGIGMGFIAAGESAERRERLGVYLDQLLAPGQGRALATFLLSPSDTPGSLYEDADAERISQRLLSASPEELREHHLVYCLLMGLAPSPSGSRIGLQPTGLETFSRAYATLKARTGFSAQGAPFYVQQQDRVVSRIAEVGLEAWLSEVNAENPLFGKVVLGEYFSADLLSEAMREPLPPGTRVVSRTLGSIPLEVFVLTGKTLFAPPEGVPAPWGTDRAIYDYFKLRELGEALQQLRARNLDFAEEERVLPGLAQLLERIRLAQAQEKPPGQ
jgi:hypothetical protein